MTLLHPLFLVPAALCLVLAFVLRRRSGSDGWSRVLSREVLALLGPRGIGGARDLTLVALAVVLAALASPAIRAGEGAAYLPAEGVVVLVDVSRSMTLEDIRPSRLAAAKAAASAIARRAGALPLALVVYAGDAFVAQPFAADRTMFASFAAALEHGMIAAGGSDPARALDLAAAAIRQSGIQSARLVFLTDGGGFGADTQESARDFAQRGMRVDAVLFALPATQAPVATDPTALLETVEASGGRVVAADALGGFDLLALGFDGASLPDSGFAAFGIKVSEWRNLSHFLLLAALPLVLLLFRRAEA